MPREYAVRNGFTAPTLCSNPDDMPEGWYEPHPDRQSTSALLGAAQARVREILERRCQRMHSAGEEPDGAGSGARSDDRSGSAQTQAKHPMYVQATVASPELVVLASRSHVHHLEEY